MTVLCITTERLPGIRPCRHLGQHRVTCRDHEGWAKRPGICRGCLPRKADRGFLCLSCYERVDEAHIKWRDFARLVIESDGRVVSPEGGGVKGPAPQGYTNLPLTFIALDECTRLLRSLTGRTLDAWVHTEAGARDAIMFAHAAERAYRSLEVEERELKLERVRCRNCDQLTLTGNTTRKHHGSTIVECQNCGEQLDKIRDEPHRWVGSEVCEHEAHLDCASVHCRCACHEYGRESQTMGVSALWDADLHSARPNLAPRALWAVLDAHTIRSTAAAQERKIA